MYYFFVARVKQHLNLKNKDKEKLLCDKECPKTVNSITEEIKAFIQYYKTSSKILNITLQKTF